MEKKSLMKIMYYVTDHGLGHATRTVAIVREFLRRHGEVVIRSNDPLSVLRKSLPTVKIAPGTTDFSPIMNKSNNMKIDRPATQKNVTKWIDSIPSLIDYENRLVEKERPDLIVSDVSIMPILLAKKRQLKSVVISNFVWSDTLPIDNKSRSFFERGYAEADLIIRLPFGSPMDFPNRVDSGLVARSLTQSRSEVRKHLELTDDQILVTIAIRGIERIQSTQDTKVVDASNYSGDAKFDSSIFVEGQNLINASDFVVCKCGYGFASECVAYGTRFLYLLEPEHKEALYIHEGLTEIGLGGNMITPRDVAKLDRVMLENSKSRRMPTDNSGVADLIEKL